VVQEIADRFHNARRRFLEGSARRFPREKKPHKYYSLTYPQNGWRILNVRGSRNRKKVIKLGCRTWAPSGSSPTGTSRWRG
jgi:putative transposase